MGISDHPYGARSPGFELDGFKGNPCLVDVELLETPPKEWALWRWFRCGPGFFVSQKMQNQVGIRMVVASELEQRRLCPQTAVTVVATALEHVKFCLLTRSL